MFDPLIAKARAEAQQVASKAAISLLAVLALCIGLAFWTGAAWFYLLTQTSAINASMILGAVYTGAGLIGFAVLSLRSAKKPEPQPAPPPPAATLDRMVAAFMSGVKAGARTRR